MTTPPSGERKVHETVYECRLCELVRRTTLSATPDYQPSIADVLLFENDEFVVTPGLGAITPGYLLITSKSHLPACSFVRPATLERLDDTIDFVLRYFRNGFGEGCAFEHGIVGLPLEEISCVNHLHVHILPKLRGLDDVVGEKGKAVRFSHLTKLQSALPSNKTDYIWLKKSNEPYNLYTFPSVPSQFVRKAYAKISNIADWDWRVTPHWDNIETTVDVMSRVLPSQPIAMPKNAPSLDPDAMPEWLARLFGQDSRRQTILAGVNDDDCAVVAVDRKLIVLTSDFLNSSPISIELGIGNNKTLGRLLVAQVLSDLCGTGASPRYMLTNITLERGTPKKQFMSLMRGIREEASKNGVAVIGGDTKLGRSRAICGTGIGTARSKRNLFLMNGARAGDLIWTSGFLGSTSAAVLGLRELTLDRKDTTWAKKALTQPQLPMKKSAAVSRLGIGRGGTDISDGLGEDLRRLCIASGVGAEIDVASIPVSREAAKQAHQRGLPPWSLTFATGGEFQFIVTTSKRAKSKMKELGFTLIGKNTKSRAVTMRLPDGSIRPLPRTGHRDVRNLPFYEEILLLARKAANV